MPLYNIYIRPPFIFRLNQAVNNFLASLFVAILLLCNCQQVEAQTGGRTVFTSLDVPASARIAASGGHLPAVRDGDLNLALYNPSLLDSLAHQRVALNYVNYFSGVNLGFASYAHHLDSSNITLAATIQYVDYGKLVERDVTGLQTGTFNAGDYALVIGAAKPIDSLFTAGVNVKGIYSTIAGFNAWGLALDAGVTYYNPKRQFTAALVVRNLGFVASQFTENVRDTLGANLMVGITKRLKHAPFRLSLVYDHIQKWDLTTPFDAQATIDPFSGESVGGIRFPFADRLMRHLTVGVEALLGDNFRINLGYNYRRRQELKLNDRPGTAGLSWGLGVRINRFDLSYGRATYHFAGPSNHITVTTRISDW